MTPDATTKVKEYLDRLTSDAFFDSEIKQVQSRALLTEVSGEDTAIRWNYIASRIIRNIITVMFGIEQLSLDSPEELPKYESYLYQFAQLWESFAKLDESIEKTSAYVNAAITYELAGYQANSTCIAKKFTKKYHEIVEPTIIDLFGIFLQRLFLQLKYISERGKREPEINDLENIEYNIAMGLASEAFSEISKYFLSGDLEALGMSYELIKDSTEVFRTTGYVLETNMLISFNVLLKLIQKKSIWTILGTTVADNPRWKRYLKLLSRGTGQNIFTSSSISDLWPTQIQALETGLLTDSSKIIRMPTSAGKTRIAEMAIAHTLITIPDSKCVYIAPYRALVWELEQAFLNFFGDLGFTVSTVLGSYESDEFEELIIHRSDILVLTPEKLDLLHRIQPDFLDNVRLIILDEGQIVDDDSRGVKFELLLTRLKRKIPQARFLFLSAVVPRETLEDFAHWLNADVKEDIIESDWRPAFQRIAHFRWVGDVGKIRFIPDIPQPVEQYVYGIIRRNTFSFVNPRTGRINTRRFPELNSKSQTSAELAIKFADLGPVLIFCPQKNLVESVAKSLEKRIEYTLYDNDASLPDKLHEDSSRYSYQVSREWLGEQHFVTKSLLRGVAIHHGDIPSPLRKAIEKDIRSKKLNIIIATNTLAQGVNLPLKTVIIHSIWRRTSDNRSMRIPARDYWNIAGRAGRAGRETEGMIIHLTFNSRDMSDFRYYLTRRKNVGPVYSALFKMLLKLTRERISEEVYDVLDPELLALLVEEGVQELTEEKIQEIFDGTLTQVQANRYGIEMNEIKKAFQETAIRINDISQEAEIWPIYSSTGLSTKSCELIREYIMDNVEVIKPLFQNSMEEKSELVEFFLDICMKLPEMQPDREFSGSYSELLNDWIEGRDLNYLVTEYRNEAVSEEALSKFIENLFGYKLPWGISSVIKIASHIFSSEDFLISPYVVFFPSIVKYGVPNPASSWGMAIGIPSRNLAIRLSRNYQMSTVDPSYEDYIGWIGSINPEYLRDTFGLNSPLLEDISHVLQRAGTNPYVKEYSSIEDILPYQVQVQGIAYNGRSSIAQLASVDTKVILERDYNNIADRNAILVKLNGSELGYIDWRIAQLAAVDMDSGLILEGIITNISEGDIPDITIEIQLPAEQ